MYDNTVSARTYLSYIAEQAGGIAVIGRDGKLYIKTIGESSATLPLKLFKTFKWGEKFKITRVRYDDGTQLFEKGDTTGNTVYISQDNMYIVDQEQIDNIYNALKDLEFYSFEGESIIDPALDTGDIVVIDGKNVIYQGSMQFSGRWIANIESKIQCKAKEETTRRIPSQKTINRRVESNINQIDGKITRLTEETTENSQKITKTEQDANGLTTKVSSVEQSVENITNTQNTATGKNIHLEDSSNDPLVSIKVKGSTSQATRSGKNLLNVTAKTTTTQGLTFTVNEDKSITINGTNTGTGTYYFRIANNFALPAGDYTLSNKNPSVNNNSGFIFYDDGNNFPRTNISNATFTKDTTIKPYLKVNAGVTVNNQTVYPMIIKGTYTEETIPEYEQYGASPSSDYRSPIENVEGKNKLNISTIVKGRLDSGVIGYETNVTKLILNKNSFTFTVNSTYKGVSSDFIPVIPNKIYVYSQNESLTDSFYIGVACYDKNKNWLKNLSIVSITIPANCYYIKIQWASLTIGTQTVTNPQLEEGTVATPYVSYNSLEIKDIGENLFDCANSKIIYNNGNASYERLDNGLKLISNGVQYNMIYFLVDTVENLKGKTLTLSSDILFSKEKQYVDFGLYYTDFNGGNRKSFGIIKSIKTEGYYTIKGIVEEGENRDYVCIGLRPNMDSNFAKGDYTIYDNLQVEIGETATPYKPYQEQKVDFPLSEGQKLYEGSYLASDGIHHKRKQIVFDGSDEDWTSYSTKNGLAYKIPILNIKQIISTTIIADLYCDYYTKTRQDEIYDEKIDYGICQRANQSQIIIRNKDILTLAEWKAWLSEHSITVEYELSEEEIVPYTTAQQEAWNKIEQLHTYKNVTNIFSDTELDIVYVRDNGLSDMYETKQNASKNYTKAVEKFAEQKITTDEINQKVAVVNEKLTEYKQNIDSFSFTTENAGGINLIQNSTLENGLDLYHSTTGTVSIEKNIDVKEKTISKSAIKIINGTVITQEINIIPLEDYTFSCLVYKTELTNVTIKIVSDKIEEYQIEAEPETWQKFSANINSSDNSVIIEIICDNNFCYISDRILNKGNAPLGWQRHNGEFKSDNVTINEDGITVTNTNDNMKHVITSSEDKIINTLNGKTEVSFNPDETKMNSTRINEKLTKGKVRETVRDDGTVMVTMDD